MDKSQTNYKDSQLDYERKALKKLNQNTSKKVKA